MPDYDTVYLAAAGYTDTLEQELAHRGARIADKRERLVFAQGVTGPAAWAANTWLAPDEIRIRSVGEAAGALRARQRNWTLYSTGHHRRAQLVAQRLPVIRFKPVVFADTPPAAPLGAWTLLDRDRVVASAYCSSAFAHGHIAFVENRREPPNRAYLKLWEALLLSRQQPAPGQTCVDLGAAPGGWSWVLARTGARVVSVDRAALAPRLAGYANIEHRRGDAFAVAAGDIGGVDWVCSDIVAYPDRLLALARYWCGQCPRAAVIITVKCQGRVDFHQLDGFLDIPGGRLLHLSHNKHELTFFRLPGGGPPEAAFSGARAKPG